MTKERFPPAYFQTFLPLNPAAGFLFWPISDLNPAAGFTHMENGKNTRSPVSKAQPCDMTPAGLEPATN
jgi:hypothetical protein